MNPPETAPKDRLILADFGWPWMVLARWNEPSGKWASALAQEGDFGECYFETEYEHPLALRGWVPMPDVARR